MRGFPLLLGLCALLLARAGHADRIDAEFGVGPSAQLAAPASPESDAPADFALEAPFAICALDFADAGSAGITELTAPPTPELGPPTDVCGAVIDPALASTPASAGAGAANGAPIPGASPGGSEVARRFPSAAAAARGR